MKIFLGALAGFVFAGAVSFFIAWDIDVGSWPVEGRMIGVLMSCFCAVIGGAFAKDFL